MNNQFDPIFITGIERSGSTIIAKIVNECGAFAGNMTVMNENKSIKRLIDILYIKYVGMDCKIQYPFPDRNKLPMDQFWGNRMIKDLQNEGYNGLSKWMYKSSRLSHTWNMWDACFPNAKWVLVRRRPTDIIRSCKQTGYMTAMKSVENQQLIGATNDDEGWLKWINEQAVIFEEMISSGIQIKEVWPERMAKGNYDQVQELVEWLGLQWNPKIPNIINPLFKNSPQK